MICYCAVLPLQKVPIRPVLYYPICQPIHLRRPVLLFDQSTRSSEPLDLALYQPIRQACAVLFYSLPVASPSTIHSAPYISRPLRGGLYCTFNQSAPSWRRSDSLLVGRFAPFYQLVPSWWLYTALFLSVGPSVGFVLHSPLSVGPSMEALYCTFYQSAPPWRLCTVLSISRPLRGGFVLYSLSVGPPWWLCTALYTSRPLCEGFILWFLPVGPSVEALYCTLYQSAHQWRL